jgi:capsule polysaccharide export protein KpsE/RkpR
VSTPTPAPKSASETPTAEPKATPKPVDEAAAKPAEPAEAAGKSEPAHATAPKPAAVAPASAAPATAAASPPTPVKPAAAAATAPAAAAAKPAVAAAAKPVATAPKPAVAAVSKAATPADEVPKSEPRVPRSAIELRAARRRILQRRYGIWVGIPTLLAIIYYLFIATSQYDSILVLAVESNEGRVTDAAGKAPNAGNLRDARLLRESLRGLPALTHLDRSGAFTAHYRDHGDWLSRLSADAGSDGTLSYYRNKVSVTHEAGTNLTTVRVRAFAGDVAHGFATQLVDLAKTWVDKQNETSSAARLKQAQAEITRERERLATAAAALAKAEQPKPTDPVAIDHKLAEQRLEAALKGFQEAQLEVGRAQRYLVVLDGPTHADSPALPRRAWGILTVLIGATVLVSVLSLLGASVREHAKF